MELGSFEFQIFLGLVVVLGAVFVALVCDFLKGNNEQLRERNIELRVRQDERERLGFFQPLSWLQGLAALARNPAVADSLISGAPPQTAAAGVGQAMPATESPAAEPRPSRAPQPAPAMRQQAEPEAVKPPASKPADAVALAESGPAGMRRRLYDEMKAQAGASSWASREELEMLAGRAARIRARHEGDSPAEKSPDVVPEMAPASPAPALKPPVAASAEEKAPVPVEPAAARESAIRQPVPEDTQRPPGPVAIAKEKDATGEPSPAWAPPVPAVPAATRKESKREATEPQLEPQENLEPQEKSGSFEYFRPSFLITEPEQQEAAQPAQVFEPAKSLPVEPVAFEPESRASEAEAPELEDRAFEPRAFEARVFEARVFEDGFEELSTAPEAISEQAAAEAPDSELAFGESGGEYASLRWQLNPSEPESPEAAQETQRMEEAEIARGGDQVKIKVLPIDVNSSERFEPREDLNLQEELSRVAGLHREPEPEKLAQPRLETAVFPTRLDLGRLDPGDVRFDLGPVSEERSGFELSDRGPAEAASAEVAESPFGAAEEIVEGEPAEFFSSLQPPPEAELELPTGLQDSSVMTQLLESAAPFHGVVVAIGINDYQSLREKLQASSDNDSIAALNRMIQSLLRPQDFAARFVEDEYILLYPGESGAAAQRRLFQVSEKLWDFQLRSLGHLSVMFSWGGLEVTNETLAEAVASARERMYQTKRNRKSTSDIGISRRRVVNG